MSGDCQREMTLDEWVERLPEIHSARKEYAALKAMVEKFTSTNKPIMPVCSTCGGSGFSPNGHGISGCGVCSGSGKPA